MLIGVDGKPREFLKRKGKMTERLLSLLIEFDEMGFAPTTVCEDSEGFAVRWKERLIKQLIEEIEELKAENATLRDKLEKVKD